eukprot:CAMPEP_0172176292 /NCGR_PEP_ID=MMETSP1050-20130122/14717_1 /TAXON_ID=233186 /ORGANISM="Cryptomonas curvata, Strain CCAP979/52" /LENGTH=325 /DNA_ID=CAMNT_0012848519 /DNA_START=136 /DNA_END=1111 /DNA_ORIENTATION=-
MRNTTLVLIGNQSKLGTGPGALFQTEPSHSTVPHSLTSQQMRILTQNAALISQDFFDLEPHTRSSGYAVMQQAQDSVKRSEVLGSPLRTQRDRKRMVHSTESNQNKKIDLVAKQEQNSDLELVDKMIFGNPHPLMKGSKHILPGVNVWGSSFTDSGSQATLRDRSSRLLGRSKHSISEREKDRLLLKQGIWTGGGGSIFAARPAHLEDLFLVNPAGLLQGLATNPDAGSNATQSANASELNATAPANASAAAAPANATAGPAVSAWSYFGLTPLDLTEDWALGESNSSDRLRIDAPPLSTSPRAVTSSPADGGGSVRMAAAAGAC